MSRPALFYLHIPPLHHLLSAVPRHQAVIFHVLFPLSPCLARHDAQ